MSNIETFEVNFSIPADISFLDLELKHNPTKGTVSFRTDVLEKVCIASNIEKDFFFTKHEDNLAEFLLHWYKVHLAHGGNRDTEVENLFKIVIDEMIDEQK